MKALIWILFVGGTSSVLVVFKTNGIMLGAIPTMIVCFPMFFFPPILCKKWDKHREKFKSRYNEAKKKLDSPITTVYNEGKEEMEILRAENPKLYDKLRKQNDVIVVAEKREQAVVKKHDEENDKVKMQELGRITTEEALEMLVETQLQNMTKAVELNKQNQPDNEGDTDFGLVPEKPIYTLAIQSVEGEKKFLNRIYTSAGERITYKRVGSVKAEGINGLNDIYEIYLPSGKLYKTIYINMYGAKESSMPPAGFSFEPPIIQPVNKSVKEPKYKMKYCSRCGSLIDRQTKVCTGCGKKYFKGIRFNKYTVTVMMLICIILGMTAFGIVQYNYALKYVQELGDEIDDLERQNEKLKKINKTSEEKISRQEHWLSYLKEEVNELSERKYMDAKSLRFYEQYAAIVPDDGKKIYHKYRCEYFDKSSIFWIYNVDAAEGKGYKKCKYCFQ